MKISLIIPHMPFPEADAALERCLESFKGQYDELILVINDGMGYGAAVNQGLKWATGDYMVVSNNDIELERGTLKDLLWHSGFSTPRIKPEPRDELPRAIFCMPRWVYNTIISCCGYFYDETFEGGYFEDDDLHKRTTNIPYTNFRGVIVRHLNGGGLTMKTIGEQKHFDINQEVFNWKWDPENTYR